MKTVDEEKRLRMKKVVLCIEWRTKTHTERFSERFPETSREPASLSFCSVLDFSFPSVRFLSFPVRPGIFSNNAY